MAKDLITLDNVESFIENGKVRLDSSRILTPGAKDELVKRHVEIIYSDSPSSSCPPGCTCPKCLAHGNPVLQSLLQGVEVLLKTEYGVTDPAQLKALSLQALQTIKENI